MKHELKEAFEKITDVRNPETVADAVRARIAEAPVRPGYRRFPKAAVIAAVMAVVFALSVGAAYTIYSRVKIDTAHDGHFSYSVKVEGEEKYASISAERLEELKNYTAVFGKNVYENGKIFANWTEAAEWLDCGLLTSDLMGGIPANVSWGGDLVLTAEVNGDGEIFLIYLFGSHTLADTDRYCYVKVMIPLMDLQGPANYGLIVSYDNGLETETLSHTTPGGIPVEIAVTELEMAPYMREGADTYVDIGPVMRYTADAYFAVGGIRYGISVTEASRDEAIRLVKLVADSFK